MKYILKLQLLLTFIFLYRISPAQNQNIEVQKVYSDTNSSTFIITIKDSVALHFHANHTENIFVLDGTAVMLLGSEKIEIQKNDYFTIPPETAHAVWVTSEEVLKVVSVQSPEFKGEDRYFLSDE